MKRSPFDEPPRKPIGLTLHAAHVDLPLSDRLKVRIGRAIGNALTSPQRSMETLRRTVLLVASELRAQGFTDEGITARITLLMQSVALERGCDATSLVSGKPRWEELTERVVEWIAVAGDRG